MCYRYFRNRQYDMLNGIKTKHCKHKYHIYNIQLLNHINHKKE